MRVILALAGALALATPAAAASVGTTRPAESAGVQLAQLIIQQRSREDIRPGWPGERRGWRNDRRRWSRDRDWDGYTGQVCRTRTVYQVNRYGERVRRVVRTCD